MSIVHTAASLLALTVASVVVAQEPPRPPAQPDQPMPEMMRRMGPPMGMAPEARMFQPSLLVNRRQVLNLTPEQVSRLEALAQDAEKARLQGDSTARGQAEQIRELWKAPAPDVGQIRSRAQAAMQAHQGAALAGLEAAARAKAVLTAEQRGRVEGWADRPRMERQMRMRRPMDGRGGRGMRPGGMRRGMRGE